MRTAKDPALRPALPRYAVLAVVCALALLAAAPAQAARTLYVADFGSGHVEAFGVGPGAALTPLGAPPGAGVQPRAPAVTPDGRFLYVATAGTAEVRGFSVAADGRLTSLGAPAAGSLNQNGTAIAPDGTRLYVAADNALDTYAIAPDGALTKLGTVTTTPQGAGVVVSPDGQTLYVASLSGNHVDVYALDGERKPAGPPTTVPAGGTSPTVLAVTPDGRFLYASNSGSNSIAGFSIGAGGGLTPLPGGPIALAGQPYDIALRPGGDALYAALFDSDAVQAFSVAADGALAPLGPPAAAGDGPMALAATPNGRALFAVKNSEDSVERFDFATDGTVASAGGATPSAGSTRLWLDAVVSPNQGPTASFTASTTPGEPTQFDGRASSDPDGSVARYDWVMGDGWVKPDAGPTPIHGYAQPGDYQVTLTVTDDEGCSLARVFSGRVVSCNPSGQARITKTVTVPAKPVPPPGLNLSNVRANRYCIAPKGSGIQGAGTDMRITYTLNDAARMTFSLQRRVTPRIRAPRGCPVRRPGGPGRVPVQFGLLGATDVQGARGENFVTAVGARAAAGAPVVKQGTRTISLRQLTGGRTLKPGWYRILLQGIRTSDGSRSQAVALKFWVLDVKKRTKTPGR